MSPIPFIPGDSIYFVLVIRLSLTLQTFVASITTFFDLPDLHRGQSLYRARDCQ